MSSLSLFAQVHSTLRQITNDSSLRQPKVAVVLSGGGAKGTAHIGALRIIEKAGIPIDYIVGTSMGALIGALYSIGYTTDQLDSLLTSQDWKVLLSDREDPRNKGLADRLQTNIYAITIPFQAANPEFANGGFIKGVNLGHLFHRLIAPYNDDLDFNTLPIPFACVAVDITNGQPHEFHSGSLQDAMRSSMSIPALFTPMRDGDKVLVDGGIMNNYPTDVARKMGADIIIGVDVQADLLQADQLRGIGTVLSQVVDVATNNNYYTKIDSTDIYIKVDVSGYSSASFSKEAIDTLMYRGEMAALSQWDDLLALRQQLTLEGRDKPATRRPKTIISLEENRELEMKEHKRHSSLHQSFAESSLNMGVRYDNIEHVSLLVGLNVKFPAYSRDIFFSAQARLGDRSFLMADVNFNLNKKIYLRGGFHFHNDDIKIYGGKSRIASINYYRNYAYIEMLGSWRQIACSLGVNTNFYRWDGLVSNANVYIKNTKYYSYYLRTLYNTLDDQNYPRQGHSWQLDYQIITDNFFDYKNRMATNIVSLKAMKALSINRNVTFLPSVSLRFIKNPHEELYTERNFLGGIGDGIVSSGQRTFSGLTHLQYAENAICIVGSDARGKISRNQYIIAGGNIVNMAPNPEDIFRRDLFWGCKIGYIYRTGVGPISATLHYSDITNRVEGLINIGFAF